MTILPIVERELRVAARRRATYWTRLVAALIAIVIGSFILLLNIGTSPARVGSLIFIGLAAVALVHCLLAGRLATADCLSQEKREGTLGLLFLTDLKGYDVVLGKLFATSIGSFYGLLSLFPVLAIPLLMGGVTSGQFWRMALLLANTFLFSLAVGMFSSALSQDHRKAMAINFGLILFFTLLIPCGTLAAALTFSRGAVIQQFCFTSPLYGFFWTGIAPFLPAAATGVSMASPPHEFWYSLGIIHVLTWFLLFLSAQIVPHSWQDKPAAPARTRRARLRELWRAWSYGNPAHRATYRKQLLDINAFYWHTARARLKPVHVWVFFGMMGLWWLGGRLLAGDVWLDEAVNITLALMVNTTLKLWLASEAAQRLADDKKIGALELLLSTPLTAWDILRGQALALRRQFLLPVAFALLVELFLMNQSAVRAPRSNPATYGIWLAGMAMLPMDLVALTFVAMTNALREKNFNRTLVGAVARVLILPWIAYGLVVIIAELWHVVWLNQRWEPSLKFYLGWWFVFGLAADLWFGWRAYHQLIHHLRDIAAPAITGGAAASAQAESATSGGPGMLALLGDSATSKKVLRATAVFILVLVLFFCFHRLQPNHPPPVAVSASLSQGPVRISAILNGALIILPDGSAWNWGKDAAGISSSLVPRRFGTNADWSQLSGSFAGMVGVRKDGTFWQSNQRMRSPNPTLDGLTQMSDDTNWVQVASSGSLTVGIKRDGTLWGWGDNSMGQLGRPVEKKQPFLSTLVQIGTDTNWAAVQCSWSSVAALRTDGTLWAWGQVHNYKNGGPTTFTLSSPTQVSRETNWLGFEPGLFSFTVRNRAGELWEPFSSAPNPAESASVTCRLVATNTAPDQVAFGFAGKPYLYQIRSDGTLWKKIFPFANWSNETDDQWHRVGRRSDWRLVQNEGATVFGLTSDGTLWTWGVDPSVDPAPDFGTKLMLFRAHLGQIFGGPPPSTLVSAGSNTPQYEKEPRPLMKLKP